jgi:hypothetical protein
MDLEFEWDDDKADSNFRKHGISFDVRGKHAHHVGKPYSVRINHGDGTSTLQKFDGTGTLIETRKISSITGEFLDNQENINENVPDSPEQHP